MKPMNAITQEQKTLLCMCYNAVIDIKAEEVLVLDLRGVSSIVDFFMICHGSSTRQVQAISDNVEKVLRKGGMKRCHIEGKAQGEWILMDLQDTVLHIFHEPVRAFYELEKLWSDAGKIDNSEILVWEGQSI